MVCEAILNGIEAARTHVVAAWAARIGADVPTVEGFSLRCAMNPGYRKVMVDTSPQVAEQLGVNSQNLPVWAFLGALALDFGQFGMVCRELTALGKRLAAVRSQAKPPETKPAP